MRVALNWEYCSGSYFEKYLSPTVSRQGLHRLSITMTMNWRLSREDDMPTKKSRGEQILELVEFGVQIRNCVQICGSTCPHICGVMRIIEGTSILTLKCIQTSLRRHE